MLSDHLISEIRKSFSGWEMQVDPEKNPIVSFPAAQKEVGAVLIHNDGDEATVFVEKISHGHFNCYNETRSQEEREMIIAEDVVGFLRALFSDRVLLFTSPDNRIGGWSRLDHGDGPVQLGANRKYYLWSKPYTIS